MYRSSGRSAVHERLLTQQNVVSCRPGLAIRHRINRHGERTEARHIGLEPHLLPIASAGRAVLAGEEGFEPWIF
jgi:hypothetical protein